MYRDVVIFHSSNANDKSFAQVIADKVKPFAEPRLVDVDEQECLDQAGLPRPEEFEGAPVYVISPALLRQPEYRKKLIASTPGQDTPGRNIPWRQGYYICHGVTFDKIRDDYPDLQNLRDDVLIKAEEYLPTLIDELRQYLAELSKHASFPQRLGRSVLVLVAYLVYALGILSMVAASLSIISALWLIGLLIFKWQPPAYQIVLICHVLFGAGFRFSEIPSLDFWQYLGPAWKFPDVVDEPGGSSQNASGHFDAEYSRQVHRQTISKWMKTAQAAQRKQLVVFAFILVPGLMSAWGTGLTGAGAIAFVGGLLMPVLWSISLRYLEIWRTWMYGMSDYEIDRTQSVFRRWPPPVGTTQWTVHRPWFAKSPWILGAQWVQAIQARVFISHAWEDDKNISVAKDLYQIATNLHLPCFLDKKRMTNKFAAFRSRLANELLTSTHFFVVLGPDAVESPAVHREIRTAMQRWYTGLEPAIICIVEPARAELLLMKDDTVPEIKFLLSQCPKLTYAEACNQEVIRHIIRQRCRQGLLQDWLALLSPASTLKRYLSDEARSMRQIH
jgi:hypothetical protein